MTRYLVGKIQESQVVALVRSLHSNKRSGQLEIEHDDGFESLFFVSGSIYLKPSSPLVDEIHNLEGTLAQRLSTWIPRSIRFIDNLSIRRKEMVGPFKTELLLEHMEKRVQPEVTRDLKRDSPPTGEREPRPDLEPGDATPGASNKPVSKPSIIPGPWTSHPPSDRPTNPIEENRPTSPKHSRPARQKTQSSDGDTQSDASQIWLGHFGLREAPFSLTPDPSYFYLSTGHVEALAGLKLGLIEKRGLMVLVGEVGTGKTTIIYSLLSSLGSDTETAYVSNPSLSFDEILESALKDLGADLTGTRRLDRLETLNDFLLQSEMDGKSVAIVIDEAQGLSRRGYEQLRLLLNFETFKSKLLQIVLVGQPELGLRLARPELRQIADRIAVRCKLKPLGTRQAERYLVHRLEAAGGSSNLFTLPARRLVIRASRGIPRRINVVCHNAMVFAFAKGVSRVDRSMVSEAIRDIKG